MEKIVDATHSKETFLFAGSRALERAGYYGLRSLIVIYMINGVLELYSTKALEIYG